MCLWFVGFCVVCYVVLRVLWCVIFMFSFMGVVFCVGGGS